WPDPGLHRRRAPIWHRRGMGSLLSAVATGEGHVHSLGADGGGPEHLASVREAVWRHGSNLPDVGRTRTSGTVETCRHTFPDSLLAAKLLHRPGSDNTSLVPAFTTPGGMARACAG